jgi:hypothetical protein
MMVSPLSTSDLPLTTLPPATSISVACVSMSVDDPREEFARPLRLRRREEIVLRLSSTMRPWSMNTMRSATRRAKPISWVTTIMVMPSCARPVITSSTSPTISGSSAEVGSSNSIAIGSIASARAIATRCCWPPESWPGICPGAPAGRRGPGISGRWRSPSSRERFSTFIWASVRLSRTDRCGNSSKFWNTMPIFARSAGRSVLPGRPPRCRRPGSLPCWKGSRPLTVLIRVDLPEPEGRTPPPRRRARPACCSREHLEAAVPLADIVDFDHAFVFRLHMVVERA